MINNPYLSVVATARNDNHGGSMLRRMQIFINGLQEQCRRYQLDAELIIVEWNPPTDKPRLAEALTWSMQSSPCNVRIIEVPPDVHRQFNHSAALPLFQMIAKNVGIRRARGKFVLATNIDLLFSDELVSFLASHPLETGKMYRLDRYDACSDVPLDAPLSEQLEYCKHNLLRVNRRDLTEDVRVQELAIIEEDVNLSERPIPQPPAWQEKIPDSALPLLTRLRKVYKRLLPTAIKDAILRQLPTDAVDWLIQQNLLAVTQPPPPPEPIEPDEPPVETDQPEPPHPSLHTNACGDFTLLSKDDWFALRGYAEFEMYSFHIDSIFCYTAAYAGLEEVVLEDPMRMYHIEHGGGWTPETEKDLDLHLARRKIPKMTYEQLLAVMDVLKLQQQAKRTFENIFNDEAWGLANETLPEIDPVEVGQLSHSPSP